MIENNKLIRETPISQNGEWVAYRRDLVITKEEFIECYNEWVVKPLQENPVSIQTEFSIPVDNNGITPV